MKKLNTAAMCCLILAMSLLSACGGGGGGSTIGGDTPPIVGDTPPIVGDMPPIVGDTPPIVGDMPPIVGDMPQQLSTVHLTEMSPTLPEDRAMTNTDYTTTKAKADLPGSALEILVDATQVRVAGSGNSAVAAQEGSAIAAQTHSRTVPYSAFVRDYTSATEGAEYFEADSDVLGRIDQPGVSAFEEVYGFYPTDFADGIIYRRHGDKIAIGLPMVDENGNVGRTEIVEFEWSRDGDAFNAFNAAFQGSDFANPGYLRYGAVNGLERVFYETQEFEQNGLALYGDGTAYIGLGLGDPVRFFTLQNLYSAIGMWMLPTFGIVDERLEEWGFRTPGDDLPTGGEAAYYAFAIGALVDTRETGESCGTDCFVITQERHFVQGEAKFSVDFGTGTIAGGVTLTAYAPNDGIFLNGAAIPTDNPLGRIAITLGELTIGSNGEFVTPLNAPDSSRPRPFSGQTAANLSVFAGLMNAGRTAFADSGRFRRPGWGGRFYGPSASEIAGGVRIQIEDESAGVENVLRFRFIGNNDKLAVSFADPGSPLVAGSISPLTIVDQGFAMVDALQTAGSSQEADETLHEFVPQVEATLPANFRTPGGTGANLVFAVSGADNTESPHGHHAESAVLLRSADGTDYVAIHPGSGNFRFTVDSFQPRGYLTDAPNPEVAENVAQARTILNAADDGTGLASANVPVAVKGARAGWANVISRRDDGTAAYSGVYNYASDLYVLETEYSALGLWIESPDAFFDSTMQWRATFGSWTNHFGLQTPAADVPSTGTATYSGIAAGVYKRNLQNPSDPISKFHVAADRFLVGGKVTLNANFANTGGISGTAVLDAYNVATPSTSNGMVTVQLSDNSGGSVSNIDGATFSGDTSIMGTPDANGAFGNLANGVIPVESTFSGFFAGPNAEEAVGSGDVKTTDDFLNFGFLTREES